MNASVVFGGVLGSFAAVRARGGVVEVHKAGFDAVTLLMLSVSCVAVVDLVVCSHRNCASVWTFSLVL